MIQPVLVEIEEEKTASIKFLPKTLAVEIEPVENTGKIVEIAPQRKKTRVWKYVAAACFLPIAFYSIWIPTRTDVLQSGMISIKDFNPFYKSAEGNYTKTSYPKDITFEKNTEPTLQEQIESLTAPQDVFSYRFTEDTYLKVNISALNADNGETSDENLPEVAPEPSIPETVETPVIATNSMNYIVGCFGEKANAENLVKTLKSKGLNAFILDVNGGFHRVSAGAALSNESMNQIRSKSDALGFQGWVSK